MMTYDVVIVGAGPAGSAAAYDLASHHVSVLLLDKCQFPRSKPCAGGLTIKALRSLRYPITSVTQRNYCNLEISHTMKRSIRLRSDSPVVLMTERSELDHYCLKKALEAGARFQVIRKIERVIETEESIDLQTENGTLRSKFLIGADGANSTIRQRFSPFSGFKKGFAIEVKAYPKRPHSYETTFDFGVAPGGYGWIFPKKDHLNVGLYTFDHTLPLKAKTLYRYANKKIGPTSLRDLSAFPIGLGGWRYFPESRKVLLVGDAAGLADPLLGEGLHNAIKSGQAAASAIFQDITGRESASSFYHKLIEPIKADTLTAYKLACWFYRFPKIGCLFLSLPPIRHILMRGYAMGLTLSEIKSAFLTPINGISAFGNYFLPKTRRK